MSHDVIEDVEEEGRELIQDIEDIDEDKAVQRVILLRCGKRNDELAEFDGEAALRVETLDAELEEMMGDDADGTLMMQVTTSVDTPGND